MRRVCCVTTNKREEDAPSAPHAMPLMMMRRKIMIMVMIMVKIMVRMKKMGMMGMMVIRRRMRTIFNIMIMAIL